MQKLFDVSKYSNDLEVSVYFTNDEEIRALNAKFRKTDRATDVLSFAFQEAEDANITPNMLGDIIISLETAQQQAKDAFHQERLKTEQQWNLSNEIIFLFIHGFLHLNGYDHINPDDEHLMRKLERQYFNAITNYNEQN